MRNFGFHNNNINGLRNAGLTRVTATLLGVRNLIEIDKTQAVPALFEKEYSDGKITSWGNPDALSVGFMTDMNVTDYAPDYNSELDVFKKTNDLFKSMGAGNVYKPVEIIPGDSSGLVNTDRKTNTLVYGTSSNVNSDTFSFSVTVKDADIGSDIYVYANARKGANVTVKAGEIKRTFEIRSYQIITLGVFDGTPIELTVNYYEEPESSLHVYGYQLDRSGYDNMLETLNDEQLEVTTYDTTSLSGHIDVKEDGLLFLTIPYAEGWTAEADGETVEIIPVQDALMGIKLCKGSHDITIRYTPAGFKEGLVISCVSVFFIAVIIAVSSIAGKIRKKKETVTAEKAAEKDSSIPEEPVVEEIPVSDLIGQEDKVTESAPVNESNEEQNIPSEDDAPEVTDDQE